MTLVKPWSYWFSDGTNGCIYAENKQQALITIIELNPTQVVDFLTLHLTPEWTLNPHCESQAVNIYPTQKP
jgi:hypothetical protein